jgi:hypothetical protein
MTAIGWSYPEGNSLEHLVDQFNLHPLTCLTTLNDTQKQHLLNQGAILCKEIVNDPNTLHILGVNEANIEQVIQEAKELCHL